MTTKRGSGVSLPGLHKPIVNGRMYIYAWRGGPKIWSGPPEDEEANAEEIVKAWLAEKTPGPARGLVGRLIHDFELSPEFQALAAPTRALYSYVLRLAHDRIGDLTLGEFGAEKGRAAIRKWRTEAAEESPRTADQIKCVVGALATWGRRADILPADCKPTADMKRLYCAPPQEHWTREEIALAASSLPAHLSVVVLLCLYTGLRRADLCSLTWSAVDDRAGMIRLVPSKGKRRGRIVRIKLTPPLRALLDQLRSNRRSVQVLTTSHGTPWTPTGLQSSLSVALDAIGIDKRLHGLRRAAATHLAAEGLSSRQIAQQLGWSEAEAEAMAEVYVDEEAVLSRV